MADKGLISKSILTDIADAIRAKDGTSGEITPSQMPTKIENLPSGGVEANYAVGRSTAALTLFYTGFSVNLGKEQVNVNNVANDAPTEEPPLEIVWSDDSKTSVTVRPSYYFWPQAISKTDEQDNVVGTNTIFYLNILMEDPSNFELGGTPDTSAVTAPKITTSAGPDAVVIADDEVSRIFDELGISISFKLIARLMDYDYHVYDTKEIYSYDYQASDIGGGC